MITPHQEIIYTGALRYFLYHESFSSFCIIDEIECNLDQFSKFAIQSYIDDIKQALLDSKITRSDTEIEIWSSFRALLERYLEESFVENKKVKECLSQINDSAAVITCFENALSCLPEKVSLHVKTIVAKLGTAIGDDVISYNVDRFPVVSDKHRNDYVCLELRAPETATFNIEKLASIFNKETLLIQGATCSIQTISNEYSIDIQYDKNNNTVQIVVKHQHEGV